MPLHCIIARRTIGTFISVGAGGATIHSIMFIGFVMLYLKMSTVPQPIEPQRSLNKSKKPAGLHSGLGSGGGMPISVRASWAGWLLDRA
jgi:hypothetical protein